MWFFSCAFLAPGIVENRGAPFGKLGLTPKIMGSTPHFYRKNWGVDPRFPISRGEGTTPQNTNFEVKLAFKG